MLTSKQFQELKRDVISSMEGRYKIVPLNSLMHSRYNLAQPLYIVVEYGDDEVVASLNEIEAFASAPTEYEALELLCEEIVMLYEDLSAEPENLGKLPTRWLNYLEGVISCR